MNSQEGLRPINKKKKTWYKEQEIILKEWAEKAACYRWLHDKAQRKYRRQNMGFTIPVIIMSTLAGTANFAVDGIFGDDPEKQENKKLAGMVIGGVNLLCGMITTVANFLRVAELNESHRVQSVSWSKFQRNLAVELALKPDDREPVEDFIKIARAEFDRLMEQSPDIPEEIIQKFNEKFKENKVTKPEVCDGLMPLKVFDDIQGRIAETVANAGGIMANKLAKSKANLTRDYPKSFVDSMKAEGSIAKEQEAKSIVNKELEELKGARKVKLADKNTLDKVLADNNPIKSVPISQRKVSFLDNLKDQIELEKVEEKEKTKEELKIKIEKDLEKTTDLSNISMENINSVAQQIKKDHNNEDIELKEVVINIPKKNYSKAKTVLLTGLKSGDLKKVVDTTPELVQDEDEDKDKDEDKDEDDIESDIESEIESDIESEIEDEDEDKI